MGSEWETSTLGDTCYITDGAHSKVERQNEGVLYLTSKNIGDGNLKLESVNYISENDFQRLFTDTKKSQRRLRDGDILTGIIGTFGNAYRYKHDDHFGISSSIAILRPNQDILNPDYLYYAITSKSFKATVEAYKGGSVQGYTNIATLKTLPIPLPGLQSQRRIAEILIALDDKIELNRQINGTLESMAQALFKSWFVDFDPVIDNALAAGNPIPEPLQARAEKRAALLAAASAADTRSASATDNAHPTQTAPHTQPDTTAPATPLQPLPADLRALFPDSFVFNEEMGWVPEGWDVLQFGELLDVTIGGDWGKDEPDDKHVKPVAIIRGTDIPSVKAGTKGAIPHRWVEEKKFKSRQLLDGDIVIEVSGGSPKQPTGRACYVTDDTLAMLNGNAVAASFCRKFRPVSKEAGLIAALHLDFIYAKGKMWGYQNQSTGISNFQTKVFLDAEMLLLPKDKRIIERFFSFVRPMIDKSRSPQSEQLAEIRDLLLPKLLSGKIQLPGVEQFAAKTL